MKNVRVHINSSTQTTETLWGIKLDDSSITALMTPAATKNYISNESATEHGMQVLSAPGTVKIKDRDIQLTFQLKASSFPQFVMRYFSFCSVLEDGDITLVLRIWEGTSFLKITYRLKYVSCKQYSEFNGRLAKFVLKLKEPNPKNRIVEHSPDIQI